MAIKELILEEIEQIPETKLTEILNFIRTFKQQLKTEEIQTKPIWEIADEIIKDIPESAFEKLPKDGAENHDIFKYLQIKNNKLNVSSTPTIEEMLNELAKIQQENPMYLESIERVDRVNDI
ncbi:hypothetical protein [Geminocystis herdmanii]|uniref:hypothetical protein n=1 Tax=Geminocystis herdmanii TaxID=669359 RepID=UPI001181C558|nr:hypothetical protein [Geminocystis herdmanii]